MGGLISYYVDAQSFYGGLNILYQIGAPEIK